MAVPEPSEREGGGTWGAGEAAVDWQRGVAARMQAFGPATEQMLDLAEIRPGSRALDVRARAGGQSLGAARRAGTTGYVLATDVSASMLEMAGRAARQAGLSNIDTRVMDAQHLELPSNSFDVVISRFALMLILDIGKALREIRLCSGVAVGSPRSCLRGGPPCSSPPPLPLLLRGCARPPRRSAG